MDNSPCINPPKVEVRKIQWDDEGVLSRICNRIDVIIHAAGMNARDSKKDPVKALDFNGIATGRLAKVAHASGVKKFIYFSTAHVYGSPLQGNLTEKSETLNTHPYATSHLAGERLVLELGQSTTMHTIVLRLSNAFGAPIHRDVNCWMLLVNELCKQAVQSRKLTLSSSGQQLRDFISLNEVCRAVAEIIVSDKKSKLLQIINLGLGVSKSVYEMAKLVQSRSKIVLGYEPDIFCHVKENNESHSPLVFMTKNLQALNISVRESSEEIEIDRLLRFCAENFV